MVFNVYDSGTLSYDRLQVLLENDCGVQPFLYVFLSSDGRRGTAVQVARIVVLDTVKKRDIAA